MGLENFNGVYELAWGMSAGGDAGGFISGIAPLDFRSDPVFGHGVTQPEEYGLVIESARSRTAGCVNILDCRGHG